MAKQPEIQYINAYVSGSMAYRMDKPVRRNTAKLPKARKKNWLVIPVDPVALAGIAVAAVLLVLLAVGYFQLQDARQDAAAMQSYAAALQAENQQLQDTYTSGYDLEEIEAIARAMGMVPVEQVETVTVEVSVPQQEAEPTAWQAFCTFLAGLFA